MSETKQDGLEEFLQEFGRPYIGYSESDQMVAVMQNNRLKPFLKNIYKWHKAKLEDQRRKDREEFIKDLEDLNNGEDDSGITIQRMDRLLEKYK